MLDTQLIPASERDSRWLMIVLHGLGDSMEGYRWLPGVMQLGWLNYLLVNAPTPYYGGFSWYDFAGDPGPDIEHSRKLLFSLLDDQRAAGFPTERTFVFGFSQGCLMAWEIGLGYPHLLAGLVGISGYCHAPEVWLRELSPVALKQKFLITHGTRDALIPFDQVREQAQMIQRAGLPVEWREFEKEHTIAGEDEMSVVRDFVVKRRSELETK